MIDLVTGGAGFIGSHLVDGLVQAGRTVRVLDDFSTGQRSWLPDVEIVEGDARDPATLDRAMAGVTTVWHLAADPEVRTGASDPGRHYTHNVGMTWEVLEACRRNGVKHFRFTSTSTVYGNATVLPTPENYGPLYPISIYGGAKLACEGLIMAHAHTFGMSAQLYRFANVVGARSNHGVTVDFVAKLRATPERLEILGDGTQNKSYVHVADTVAAMLHADGSGQEGAFNIGSADGISVMELAAIVADVMALEPEYATTGGAPDGAGWTGDVKRMGLAIDKLQALGWQPAMGSAEAIRATAAWLVAQT